MLQHLEQTDGNFQAAEEARKKAIQSFLVYRYDGGENYHGEGRLALAVLQAIQKNEVTEIKQEIQELLEREDLQKGKIFFIKLLSILAGERDPILIEDNKMSFEAVVELKILLEQLHYEKVGSILF